MSGLVPPFTFETANRKVKVAQDLWNTQDAARVALAYTPDCRWRNRDQFPVGREQIVQFLTKKWQKEKGYRLRKELFAFTDNKIAVTFWYEWYEDAADGTKQWWRTYGLEDWTFNQDGIMEKRQMSGNDKKIADAERWFTDDVPDVNTAAIPEHEFL
ncbi:nuclear transport factor 2 family protein [Phanerochaete sordida]|uniref:Nuclear transport factor 2 family protein n=1 Tax=Phanerochaete sordida TaxID=48140 RepID=A0A9P3GP05_9APHY|nr:nuclear transport factor 2 family protein [Phanerochaete sordida]